MTLYPLNLALLKSSSNSSISVIFVNHPLGTFYFYDDHDHDDFFSSLSDSNWIEWSTIQEVIGRVISKSAEREAQGRFEITSMITP